MPRRGNVKESREDEIKRIRLIAARNMLIKLKCREHSINFKQEFSTKSHGKCTIRNMYITSYKGRDFYGVRYNKLNEDGSIRAKDGKFFISLDEYLEIIGKGA